MRPDSALRAGHGRIVDNAVGIDGEVDHAIGCPEDDLRLRSGHRLIGKHVANYPAAVGRRVIMMRFSPRLNEMT